MKKFSTQAIRKRREQLGLTLSDVATLVGLNSNVSYYQYESGKYKFKAEMLPRLALALRCRIDDFYV